MNTSFCRSSRDFISKTAAITHKELLAYFISPLAYVFITIFLLLNGLTTFGSAPFGNFLGNNEASLSSSFFSFMPWLLLILIPPFAMKMWSEEQKSGSIELLLTMPVSITEVVIGKFIAAWILVSISIFFTFPLVITVNYLGNPDMNIIISGYCAAFLLAGCYLSLGSLASALCKNQIIAYIINLVLCLFMLLIGHPSVNHLFTLWLPPYLNVMISELSLFPHFSYMNKGTFEVSDVVYFLSIIIFGLFITAGIIKFKFADRFSQIKFMSSRLSSGTVFYASLISFALILINVNFFINILFPDPIDITSDRLFSFSSGTKNILSKLKYPVTIRFYRSGGNSLPVQLISYAGRIEDLLRNYVQYSRGKVIVEYLDPQPDSPEEESAIMDNIQPNSNQSGEKCYLGLSVSCLDRSTSIAFLSLLNEKTIEYDITRSIYDMTHPEKPTVGVISSLNVMGSANAFIPDKFSKSLPWIFIQELQRNFDIKELPYDSKTIDESIKVLMLIHPAALSVETEFAIDQYIMRGGSVLIFLDPYCLVKGLIAPKNPLLNNKPMPDSSTLTRLLSEWKISFSAADEVVLSPENAYKQPNDPLSKVHPAVLNITPGFMNSDTIVTSGINSLNLVFAGGFSMPENSSQNNQTEYLPLVFTSPESAYFKGFNYFLTSEELLINFKSGNKPINLAVYIKGFFDSAFARLIQSSYASDSEKYLLSSQKEGNVILVGDVDMLFNNFCVSEIKQSGGSRLSMINNNIDFVMNCVDFLSGDTDIMSIRSRSSLERKFTRLETIYNKSAKLYQEKLNALQRELVETESSITGIQGRTGEIKLENLTSEELRKLQEFRKKAKKTKTELQNIRRELRAKLDTIKSVIIFLNAALMPVVFIIIGITVGTLRKRRHKKHLEGSID